MTSPSRSSPLGYLFGLGAVGAAALVSWGLREHIAEADLVMVFLLAVVLVALRWGFGPSLFTVIVGVAAFDFFFVPPQFTFGIDESKYVITFVVMAVVGLMVMASSAHERRQREAVRSAELEVERERLRNAILSSVSHDLRTPLGTIVGAAGSLLHPGPGLDLARREELLATIHGEAHRLTHLVENLLDMARIQAERGRVRAEWQVPEEIAGTALARVSARLGQREVQCRCDPEDALVSFDAALIELALVNLIENAIRHTPEGTPIEIVGQGRDGRFTFEVRDRGAGLPAEGRERLFDKFYRGTTSNAHGSGLGLAIVKTVVEAHGGTVSAAERTDGPGAVFAMSLPWTEEARGVAEDARAWGGASS